MWRLCNLAVYCMQRGRQGVRACSTVMRLRGSNCSMASSRSTAAALASGNSVRKWHLCAHCRALGMDCEQPDKIKWCGLIALL